MSAELGSVEKVEGMSKTASCPLWLVVTEWSLYRVACSRLKTEKKSLSGNDSKIYLSLIPIDQSNHHHFEKKNKIRLKTKFCFPNLYFSACIASHNLRVWPSMCSFGRPIYWLYQTLWHGMTYYSYWAVAPIGDEVWDKFPASVRPCVPPKGQARKVGLRAS